MDDSFFPNAQRVSYLDAECSEDLVDQSRMVDPSCVKKLSTVFQNFSDEKIQTFLRIRPKVIRAQPSKNGSITNNSTSDSRDKQVINIVDPTTIVIHHKESKVSRKTQEIESHFTFTKILGPDCTQSQVFEDCVSRVVDRFFSGENCLIFSYGATNSGKTYTMQGYGINYGMIPRTLEYIFNHLEGSLYYRDDIRPGPSSGFSVIPPADIARMRDTKKNIIRQGKIKTSQLHLSASSHSQSHLKSSGSSVGSDSFLKPVNFADVLHDQSVMSVHHSQKDTYFSVWVSFAEVYDLLEQVAVGKRRRELKIIADTEGNTFIKDLSEYPVHTREEAYDLLLAGKANLQFASTQMNSTSSRSHSFFNIRILAVGVSIDGREATYPRDVYKLSFCDLAGVERASETGNAGIRLKESGQINQSLLVLLRCIRGLRDQQSGRNVTTSTSNIPEHLPFRESKLARLFQSYLTISSRISMIVNINPDPSSLDSTLQVLHNSAVASDVLTIQPIKPNLNNESKFFNKIRHSLGSAATSRTINDFDESSIRNESSEDNTETEEEENSEESSDDEPPTVKRRRPESQTECIVSLKKTVHDLEEKISGVEQSKIDLINNYRKLLAENTEYYTKQIKESQETRENFCEQRVELAKKIAQSKANKELTRLKVALAEEYVQKEEKLQEEISRLKSQFDNQQHDIENGISTMSVDASDAEQEWEDCDENKENSEDPENPDTKSISTECSLLSSSISSKYDSAVDAVENLKIQNETLSQEVEELNTKVKEYEMQIDNLQRVIKDKDAEIVQRHQSEQQVRSQLDCSQETFRNTQAKLLQIEETLEESQKEIETLRAAKLTDNSVEQLKLKDVLIKDLEQQITDGAAAVLEYDAKLADANKLVQIENKKRHAVEKKLQEKEEEFQMLSYNLDAVENRNRGMEDQIKVYAATASVSSGPRTRMASKKALRPSLALVTPPTSTTKTPTTRSTARKTPVPVSGSKSAKTTRTKKVTKTPAKEFVVDLDLSTLSEED